MDSHGARACGVAPAMFAVNHAPGVRRLDARTERAHRAVCYSPPCRRLRAVRRPTKVVVASAPMPDLSSPEQQEQEQRSAHGTPGQSSSSGRNYTKYMGSEPELELNFQPRRKIAIVVEPTPFTHVSGYSNRFKTLLKWLNQAGDEVLVITPDNSPDAPSEFEGAKIINVRGFRFPLYKHITLSFGFRGVYAALKAFQPDVLHVSTPGFMVFTTMLYARLLRVPMLFSYHTHLPVYARAYGLAFFEKLAWWFIRFVHNRADATLATSPQLCNELLANGVERVGLWRKGVDTDVFNPQYRSSDMRMRMSGGHPDAPLLVYVGRLGAEKNLPFIKHVLNAIPNTRLALVGNGPVRDELEKATFAEHRGSVVFMGQMSGVELSQAFASADLFVMPSESETLGFVVMESMASGVPVVGARAGGVPDLISHGQNGLLFEPGNAQDAIACVRSLLENKEKRDVMALEARKEAERWNWQAATAVTRNLHYRRAMSNFRFRMFWGLGRPRSLTWLRWFRRRLAALFLWVRLRLGLARAIRV
ncbi:Sulfoquinovosyl transferase SQD2 [Porphyridium purpureum]|uniref:Sulfoquinovosyl transferase SQD2 n=1 Tax=Porphyridium purpureum TaxID=35688 RepID=A0A5J4Z8G3_PORPP|nr:Sulfoquinovosyl transferase SQD2 [Porphyridium purpureum]|eukprot:POR7266..scf295_1